MRHAWLLLCALTAALALAQIASAKGETSAAIQRLERRVWYWQSLMRLPLTRDGASPALLRRLAAALPRRAAHPPHEAEWRCIHRYEGSWTAHTGNGYYGGLQMDIEFQSTYAPGLLRRKGTADRWSPLEQMWVAERAHRSGRGFTPWPNTARMCGLL